jgi:hypothetical protein
MILPSIKALDIYLQGEPGSVKCSWYILPDLGML